MTDAALHDIQLNIDNTKIRIDNLEDRIEKIETDLPINNVYNEIMERTIRRRNLLIFNLDDSQDAKNTDLNKVKSIITNSGLTPPLNLDDMQVLRLGKSYNSNKSRPLKIIMKNDDHVHWFFQNKSIIFGDTIKIKSDQTKNQMNELNNLRSLLKTRLQNGESNLTIKYIHGKPQIVETNSR